jgi:glycosyltransferase involved in cell wall biosynthesis
MKQEELPAIYRRAALFVAPFVKDSSGDQEGLPVALMEAVGTGCPFVVGDVPGIGDMLGNARSAFCVDSTSPSAIADAVGDLLDNPIVAHDFAVQVRSRIADLIDWESVAGRYGDLLDGARRSSAVSGGSRQSL